MAKKKEITKTVGVIGLGNMGQGIARNLGKAGHEVLVWDISEDARKKFFQWVTKSILETGIDESIDKSNTIIKTLNSAAQATLPNKRKTTKLMRLGKMISI